MKCEKCGAELNNEGVCSKCNGKKGSNKAVIMVIVVALLAMVAAAAMYFKANDKVDKKDSNSNSNKESNVQTNTNSNEPEEEPDDEVTPKLGGYTVNVPDKYYYGGEGEENAKSITLLDTETMLDYTISIVDHPYSYYKNNKDHISEEVGDENTLEEIKYKEYNGKEYMVVSVNSLEDMHGMLAFVKLDEFSNAVMLEVFTREVDFNTFEDMANILNTLEK